MQDKELIINKNKELLLITNRKEYTKLILKGDVNPILLNGFTNVKELTLCKQGLENFNYNEQNLNLYPFASNLEKINFINIRYFGKKEIKRRKKQWYDRYSYYKLDTPNLKIIEFPECTDLIKEDYLKKLSKLEQIIFNISLDTRINSSIYTKETKLKQIILKTKYDTFEVTPDYLPKYISCISFNSNEHSLKLIYSNDLYTTHVDVINGKINFNNALNTINDDLIIDNCFFIPDIANEICIYNENYMKNINKISLNIKLLKFNTKRQSILNSSKLRCLEQIILRTDNEMSLFEKKEFNIKEYGTLEELYIENHKLCLKYENFIIEINESGILDKKNIEKEEIKIEKPKEINLDEYTIEELESYIRYRKLLEFKNDNDQELNNALDVIGDRIVKKLTK